MKKKIGIVGGMGPMATVDLFQMIVRYTDSADDQGHIRIFIDNNTQIPDRTAAILRGDDSPAEAIIGSAKGLAGLGADMILIPCNTAHYFYEKIQAGVDVEVVNMIDETAKEISRRGLTQVGLLATTGTVRTGLYRRYCEKRGITVLEPDEKGQSAVMDFIYAGVKASNASFDTGAFRAAAEDLLEQGAQALILGCTELPVGFKMYGIGLPNVNTLEVLAKTAVGKAGYTLKEEQVVR